MIYKETKANNIKCVRRIQKTLPKYSSICSGYSINKYVKIKKDYSVYDEHEKYWAMRATYAVATKLKIKLSKLQNHKCSLCQVLFVPGDILEVDHIIPKSIKGSNAISNLRLIHGHCHDQREMFEKKKAQLVSDVNDCVRLSLVFCFLICQSDMYLFFTSCMGIPWVAVSVTRGGKALGDGGVKLITLC